jgi:prepilin-type N-terminal cleavage/methylation domain-containing protein
MRRQQELNRRGGRPGFSLIELLVVVGIIGILIGILVPVITRAQAASRSVTCVSTLRNIGVAFNSYASANNMTYPDPSSVEQSWEQLLAPYHNGEFKCPSDEELYPTVGSSYDWRDTPEARTTLSGVPLAAVKRPNVILAFEALSGWHKKRMINVVQVDGAVKTIPDDECFADLDTSIDPQMGANFKRR